MTDPKIYLAVDNCFASKRWTRPAEWMSLLQSMGVNYVEASADNECDPLYMGEDYIRRWINEVNRECERTGVRIANMYSGHGTYTTLGLAHHDPAMRERFQHQWIEPMADLAASVGAGIGFYCHAFSDAVLQDPAAYLEIEADLYARLAEIAIYCRDRGIKAPGVEQMYTPHQIPWTIEGSKRLLKEVYRSAQAPFYLTLDTGHQSGQHKFIRPDRQAVADMADSLRQGESRRSSWLGPRTAQDIFQEMLLASESERDMLMERLMEQMNRYPYLFSSEADSDTYSWLEQLGCFSPIIHLQQTTGRASSHLPFTDVHNEKGVIAGDRVLRALGEAYQMQDDEELPPKCEEIYLTLEIFSGTSELYSDILANMQESVTYWRRFIPEDGLLLSELLKGL